MHQLRSNIELCSLSILADLIQLNELSAAIIFSELCGLDRISGESAIKNFQSCAARDAGWLEILSAINSQTLPQAMMNLLTDAFGLCELDAIDAVIRIQISGKQQRTHSLN